MTQLCIYLIWSVIKKQIRQSERKFLPPKRKQEKINEIQQFKTVYKQN